MQPILLHAQTPSRDELARQLREQVETLQALRAQQHALEQQAQQQRDALDVQIDRLRADQQSLEESNQTLAAELAQQQQALEMAQQQVTQGRDAAQQIAAALIPVAQAARQRVAQGPDADRQVRLAELDQLLAQLRDSDPAVQFVAVQRWWTWAASELPRMRTIEVTNDLVSLPEGRQKHAHVIRIGLLQKLMLTEDGRDASLGPNSDGVWEAVDMIVAQSVGNLLDILKQRKPPQVVPVPLRIGAPQATSAEGAQ